MAELVLYTNPMSRGRIARWMLEEVGEPYRAVMLDFATSMKTPEYLAVNPMGKVPALSHGDAVVTETAAICAYLADAFPGAGLAPPPGSPARARYLRALFYAAGPVEAAVVDKSLGVTVAEDKRGMVGYGGFDDAMDGLEAIVGAGPYILGEAFSAADVYVGSQVMWGLGFGTIPTRPAFADYAERLRARPASVRASALDDAELPEEHRGKM